MPVYHFTFHAYGSWLPDRPEGYTPHGMGWQPPSNASGDRYRKNMHEPPPTLEPDQQHVLMDELTNAQAYQRITLYAAATDPTHVHAVVAWRDEREPTSIRSQLKSSMTRALNTRFGKRQWFVAKAGQTPVADEEHLHHLVHEYLPKHEMYWRYNENGSNDR